MEPIGPTKHSLLFGLPIDALVSGRRFHGKLHQQENNFPDHVDEQLLS